MYTIGLDVHKNSSYYLMIDDAGRKVKKGRFPVFLNYLLELQRKRLDQ